MHIVICSHNLIKLWNQKGKVLSETETEKILNYGKVTFSIF